MMNMKSISATCMTLLLLLPCLGESWAGSLTATSTAGGYQFTATAQNCCPDYYDWYLQSNTGYGHYITTTGVFQGQITFTEPSSLPAGQYHAYIEMWIWDTINGYWVMQYEYTNTVTIPLSAYDVGVISTTGNCPSGVEKITFFMDNEDSDPASYTSGWTGGITTDGNKNTTFNFCRTDGQAFRALGSTADVTNNYAVLKLGTTCPNGSHEIIRHFDNEDSNNKNWVSGSIYPNTYGGPGTPGWTKLHFCLFTSHSSTMDRFPKLNFDYGVFAANDMRLALHNGVVHTDDQDRNNQNTYTAPPSVYQDAIRIISDGANTLMKVVQVRRELTNGAPVSGLSGAQGDMAHWTFHVPAGMSNVRFDIAGGPGDADLYVRYGAPPTTATYNCRPYSGGSTETCSFSAPAAGTWYVMIRAYSSYSGVSLTAQYW